MAETDNLSSSLSESTRKERRLLLIMSIFLLVVVPGGLRPTRIAALGVDFTLDQPDALLAILFAIHTFVLVSFIFAARADGRVWLERFSVVRRKVAQQIHECHTTMWSSMFGDLSELSSPESPKAGFQPQQLPGALDLIRSIIDMADPHLRPHTIKLTTDALNEANWLFRYYTSAGAEWFAANKTYGHPSKHLYNVTPGAIAQLSTDLAAIHRAYLQRELLCHYQDFSDFTNPRARALRFIHRKEIQRTSSELRRRHLSVDSLRDAITLAERIITPTVDDPRIGGLPLQRIKEQTEELKSTIHNSRLADDFTCMTLARIGSVEWIAGEIYTTHLSAIEADIARSMGRFGGNAFWEIEVPVVIGTSTLLLTALHVYVVGYS
jgi:hypothetical protein